MVNLFARILAALLALAFLALGLWLEVQDAPTPGALRRLHGSTPSPLKTKLPPRK